MQETKICSICKNELPATTEYFPYSSKIKNTLRSACKKCTSIKNKERHKVYYEKNKEKVNAKNMGNYYKNHPKEEIPEGYKKCSVCGEIKPLTIEYFNYSTRINDGFRGQCKECRVLEYRSNLEHNKDRSRKNYNNNKEYISIRNKAYKEKNREFYRKYDKIYYQENSEKIIQRSKEYLYNRVENDLGFKILQRCRSRLYKAVKNHSKSARTQELIGCTTDELLKHLESQFTDGMTWENYGEWHIDHIMPCASFDFSKEEEQRKCFNYKNLQPLWAEDNYRKHDKIIASL